MTFTAAWIATLLRSLLLIMLALPCCQLLSRWAQLLSARQRGALWGLFGLIFLFPELLTGYAYSQTTRLLIRDVWIRELWFDGLLLLRVIPIGAWLWSNSPPSPLSPAALHLRRLAFRGQTSLWRRTAILSWYWLQGPGRAPLFAACGLFLVLFQEFELASLLATTSWTVWLFDAQAGGVPLAESLRYSLPPAICTWLMCGLWPWAICGQSFVSASHQRPYIRLGRGAIIFCWSYLVLALAALVIYPVWLIGRDSLAGASALVQNSVQLRGLIQGILVAGGYGLISGVLADQLAIVLTNLSGSGISSRGCLKRSLNSQVARIAGRLGLLVAGVGLVGPLIIGLCGVAILQLPALHPVYDTPLPVILGLVLWLLPRACLLQAMLQVARSPAAEHSARLLFAGSAEQQAAGQSILWRLRGRSELVVRLLLCHWAYWDLTLPKILAPTGLEPATTRLYIDMHFGRNAILTAKAAITLAAPLVVLALCWPWLKRRRSA